MQLHRSRDDSINAYIFFDNHEKIVELPTNFINFLASSPKNRAQGTIKLYAYRLNDFCVFLELHPVFGQVRVDQAIHSLKMVVIDEFYKSLINNGLEASTIKGYEVVIKTFVNWLSSEYAGYIHKKSLYFNVSYRTPRPSKRMPRFLVPEEVIQLAFGMYWEFQRLVTHFIYDTGLRVSEVSRVLKSDIPSIVNAFENNDYFPLLVRGSKGRGGFIKERYTFISRPVIARINRYFKSRAYIYADQWPT